MGNRKKAVMWGAGTFGSSEFYCNLVKDLYDIICYCDSDKRKKGTSINGYDVRSIEEIVELNRNSAFNIIIIAVKGEQKIKSIRQIISENLNDLENIEVYDFNEVENEYIIQMQQKLDYKCRLRYKEQAKIWLDNIMSEVSFWINNVAKKNSPYWNNYCYLLQNANFESKVAKNIEFISEYLCNIEDAIVYDIGCGLMPLFGERLKNGRRVSIIEVDPLAYFYNIINEKYAPDGQYKKIAFGMFEYISKFFDINSADVVIINNALDHCIDPYRSIVECLMILKPEGILHLNHHRAEGIFEAYNGLHQWNLDYNEKNEFIIWNYNMIAVNVTERLKDVASIQVQYPDGEQARSEQYLCVEITKKKNFDLGQYVDTEDETKNMAYIIDKLMQELSNPDINTVFNHMLAG